MLLRRARRLAIVSVSFKFKGNPMKSVNIAAVMSAHIDRHYTSRAAAARAFGTSAQYVSMVCNGERRPTQAMLDAVGYEAKKEPAKVRYVRKASDAGQ